MNRRFRRTTIITAGLLGFLVGLVLGRQGVSATFIWLGLGIGLLLGLLGRTKVLGLMAVVLLGITLGAWRGSGFSTKLKPLTVLFDQKISLVATATSDAVYGSHQQLDFTVNQLDIVTPSGGKVPGSLRIEGFGSNMIHRGDTLKISGKLHSFQGSNQGIIAFAKLEVLSQNKSWFEDVRHKFLAGLESALPEPNASFGSGLLVGLRSTIPKDINDQLSKVGLTHIVAVSGYNLTIIVSVVVRLLKGRSKFQTTMLSLGLITLFLVFTGLSASIIRAAVVSVLSIWAWYYGRRIKPVLLIAVAAALTAGWNPLYIWSDIGWYLSFLAFFGVMVLAPGMVARYKSKGQVGLLGLVLSETISAQIMTLPIILFTFHRLSVFALLANVVIVPLVPLAMLFTFVAGLAGMLLPALAGWLAWPANLLLTYMLDLVRVIAKIPHSLVSQSVSVVELVIMYGLIVLAAWLLWRKAKPARGIITDKNNVDLW